MENVIKEFKRRLENLIDRRGNDEVFELSFQVIDALESEMNIHFTEEQLRELDNIVEENYK